ncbi:MAG: precorrin-4 C(11)-methyltransferase [Pseudanabaenaceae cyanobacterium bins.39]|nr:precorrin-4 C(11)-methyltransferase [Pseudanabaenaceae cyanobacterium bins.39]
MNKQQQDRPIYIVGAGPGDPDLITVKGRQLLETADLVVYANSLIPETMLQCCRADAEIVPTASKSLEEIVAVMVAGVRSQKLVVRLHDGDPSLYGAIHEQMEALARAEISFEIIPGVSAFQLAAARLQAELTVPELVQTIILTRISGRTQVPAAEELSSLAAHRSSLCLYLSANHVEQAQIKLGCHYPPDTPVAICYRLGWEDEQIIVVPLAQMAEATKEAQFSRTTLFVISPALSDRAMSRMANGQDELANTFKESRSHLYNATYPRLFRGGLT